MILWISSCLNFLSFIFLLISWAKCGSHSDFLRLKLDLKVQQGATLWPAGAPGPFGPQLLTLLTGTILGIPDASRRPPPTPQDFGCISFLSKLSREICQKVDVVWFEKLQSLWWSSQLGDSWGEVAGSWGQVDYREAILAPSWGQVWPFCGWCWS